MWTDQQEIEREKEFRTDFVQKVYDIKKSIEKLTGGNYAISNIGIILNNKMVEIYQIYKKSHVSYAKSSLRIVLSFYFSEVVLEAERSLQEYADNLSANISKISATNTKEELSEVLNQANPKLQEYEKLSDEVFNFDLNKDIIKAVEKDIEIHEQIEKEGGYNYYSDHPESVIEQYNQELEALGMTIRIPITVIENIKHKGNNTEEYEEAHSEIGKIDYSAIKQDIADAKTFLEQYNEELSSLGISEVPIVQNEDEDNYHR